MAKCDNSPLAFTHREGEYFLTWVKGKVNGRQLNKRSKTSVLINNVLVHSFVFPTLHGQKLKRWDCINGWNTNHEY